MTKVAASYVVILAFDRHFESPTLPSLVYFVILYRAPCTRSGGPLALYIRISPQSNTCRTIGLVFLATSVCVTHHDKTSFFTPNSLGGTATVVKNQASIADCTHMCSSIVADDRHCPVQMRKGVAPPPISE
jgi:hypothetical protein